MIKATDPLLRETSFSHDSRGLVIGVDYPTLEKTRLSMMNAEMSLQLPILLAAVVCYGLIGGRRIFQM